MTVLELPHLGARFRWRLSTGPTRPARSAAAVVDQVLTSRGLQGAAAEEFLAGGPPEGDPFLLAGMADAVERLHVAVRAGELVAVYGDYDVDGISGTALVLEALWALGGRAKPYLPHRERDGYGVHAAALEYLAGQGVKVVVTVDCGVRDAEALERAGASGLDVIVTDHHTLPAELPRATAVINPRRDDCRYAFTSLAGAGLAYKLAQALLESSGPGPLSVAHLEPPADLVALGTIADVVPLVGENRRLVGRGLEVMRAGSRTGLVELMASAELSPERLTAEAVAWSLAPRLNAAGRLDHALPALELLLTSDRTRARQLARELSARNRRRQALTRAALDEAEAALGGQPTPAFVVHVSEIAPVGVLGLVAGRLCERLYRPVAAVRVDGPLARGSVRSIPELDAAALLDEVAPLLRRYGGHARAAGFTVRTADLPELSRALAGLAERRLDTEALIRELAVDAAVEPGTLGWPLHGSLEELAPFGEGNPRPLLLVRAARAVAPRLVGDGHLAFTVDSTAGGPVRAIAFRQPAGLEIAAAGPVDIVATLEAGEWKGEAYLELKVSDIAPAA